jgi:DNA-binding winged helix-turn-helix (wHTH) protein/predicted ATPase
VPESTLLFSSFRLDLVNVYLWHGSKRIPLTPKDFAVLHYLATHSGQLVTHAELLKAVWPNTIVSPEVLKVCLRRIRRALRDKATAPQFIETVHRRGYRFIAPLTATPPVPSFKFQVPSQEETRGWKRETSPPSPQASSLKPQVSSFVGREAELAQLQGWLTKALSGERQIVLITGEPGIGKTTVVDAFLQRLPTESALWLGRGQCIEHFGAGEAYLSVLEALGRLCRAPGGDRLIALLSQHAPTWLVQMPALLSTTDLEALQRKVLGATRDRMLREMAEALEVLTAERPLVLVVEDLHWSDPSTLDLLAFLARRREAARLLVIGTHRPLEAQGDGHPLKGVMQELHAHSLCTELALRLLNEAEVAAYLNARFPLSALPAEVARVLHQRTEGNPLFLVNMVSDLVAQGMLVEVEGCWTLQHGIEAIDSRVPESIRQLVTKQSERLPRAEQQVLEAASVAGMEFSAAAVAAALETDVVAVEEQCAGLATRQQFLRPAGIAEWPDGTLAARYGFLHAVYQQLWHERVSVSRLQHLHLRIGERKELAYGKRAAEIATELAVHFDQGRDYRRAVQYLRQAGENATQRSAYGEAVSHFTKGVELLETLPQTPECLQQELMLQIALGGPLIAAKGYGAPEVEKAYARARELCQQESGTPQFFRVLWGLWTLHLVRADYQTARELGEQYLNLARRGHDSVRLLQGHDALGTPLFYLGEFAAARDHMEQGLALYDPQKRRSPRALQDLGVDCLCYLALALWHLGYPAQARERIQAAITLARKLEHPFSLAGALGIAAWVYQYCHDGYALQACTEEVLPLSTEQGFPLFLALGTLLRGWTLAELGQQEEGISHIRQGLAAWRATGAELSVPYYLALLAEAYGQMGQPGEGLSVLAAALEAAHSTEERFYEAELYRLKGELTLQKFQVSGSRFQVPPNTQHPTPSPQAEAEAEAYFQKAIGIARRQQAQSLELRAVMSLSRLWQQQGKTAEARRRLAEIYAWFTEGFDTADLRGARRLLEELNH